MISKYLSTLYSRQESKAKFLSLSRLVSARPRPPHKLKSYMSKQKRLSSSKAASDRNKMTRLLIQIGIRLSNT
jgi:hypothetical protein